MKCMYLFFVVLFFSYLFPVEGKAEVTLYSQFEELSPAAVQPEKTAKGIIVQLDGGQAELAVTPSGASA